VDYDAILRRIGHWIPALAAAGALASIVLGRPGFALAVLLGGAAAWLGYHTHRQMVDHAVARRRVRHLWLKVSLRYGLILLLLYVMIRFDFLSAPGFLLGLASPAAAVLVEGCVYVVRNLLGDGRR
jgi:hypothetical protein